MTDGLHARTSTRREVGYGPWRSCRGPWTAGFARVPVGPRVDGCFAPAHRLTTAPWTTAARRVSPLFSAVALSHLENCCAVHHTAHSLDDDEQTVMKKEYLQIREHT